MLDVEREAMNIDYLKEHKKIIEDVIAFLQSPYFAGMYDDDKPREIPRWIEVLREQINNIESQIRAQEKPSS